MDFQDITPVTATFETTKGALNALMDDPVLNRADEIERDPSLFYLRAKLQGVNDLREGVNSSQEFVPLVAAALICYCDGDEGGCHAAPEEPCVSDDGSEMVSVHKIRVETAKKNIRSVVEAYLHSGVKIDGEYTGEAS